jgi:hypothetical protein
MAKLLAVRGLSVLGFTAAFACGQTASPSPIQPGARTMTCGEWNQPTVYSPGGKEPDSPAYHRAPSVFGAPQTFPALQVQLLEEDSGRKVDSDAVQFVYSWRWLQPPTPAHPHGGWVETADTVSCRISFDGTIEAAAHEVRPRGWYDGEPSKKPEFTGVALLVSTDQGRICGGFAIRRWWCGSVRGRSRR